MESSSAASHFMDDSLSPTDVFSELATIQHQHMTTVGSSATSPVLAPPFNAGTAPPSATYVHPPYSTLQPHLPMKYSIPLSNTPFPIAYAPQYQLQESVLRDSDVEEMMDGLKAASSRAISRAVRQASKGEYGYAIATLIAAISLVKQSKVASHLRATVLIESLQHCLRGVESKSFASRSRRIRSPPRGTNYHPYKDQRTRCRGPTRKQDGENGRRRFQRKDGQGIKLVERRNRGHQNRYERSTR